MKPSGDTSFKSNDFFHKSTSLFKIHQIRDQSVNSVDDHVVSEAPLQIILNGEPYTVTMRTGGDDKDLVTGILYAENIIQDKSQILSLRIEVAEEDYNSLSAHVHLPEDLLKKKKIPERSISNSSCGVCGIKSLRDLNIPFEPLVHTEKLTLIELMALYTKMREGQVLFDLTGGCHAAGLYSLQGELLALKEDVGRHNAVDKAVGALVQLNNLAKAKVLLVSGRVSYEIVVKAYRAKIPYILAVSAPSDYAVLLCKELGMTLIGFCREGRGTIYSHRKSLEF